MPIARNCHTAADMEAWYPPGHGDFYESFYNAGLLEDFIKQVVLQLMLMSIKLQCMVVLAHTVVHSLKCFPFQTLSLISKTGFRK